MYISFVPARGTTARRCLGRFAILTIAAAASLNAQAALYLKFAGVDGGSTAVGHEKWNVIQQASLNVTSTTSPGGVGGGGGGAGKTIISDIN